MFTRRDEGKDCHTPQIRPKQVVEVVKDDFHRFRVKSSHFTENRIITFSTRKPAKLRIAERLQRATVARKARLGHELVAGGCASGGEIDSPARAPGDGASALIPTRPSLSPQALSDAPAALFLFLYLVEHFGPGIGVLDLAEFV